MRHGKKINHLGRTAPHRNAMLSNMATSLIQNKRIVTTVAKAKALRKYVEPLITKSKTDTTHSRRMVFRYLQDKESVNTLFNEVSEKVSDRPGGYTRILKTGNRLGDNASMCVIELVDYNESLLKEAKPKRAKTRRSRRGGGAAAATAATAVTATEEAVTEEAEVIEEQVEGSATEEVKEAVETAEVVDEAASEEAVAEETAIEEATDDKETEVEEVDKKDEQVAKAEASAEEQDTQEEQSDEEE